MTPCGMRLTKNDPKLGSLKRVELNVELFSIKESLQLSNFAIPTYKEFKFASIPKRQHIVPGLRGGDVLRLSASR